MSQTAPAPVTAFEDAFEASWPAAEYAQAGVFRIGRGLGGGRRVSSARPVSAGWSGADIDRAIAVQTSWQQNPAFRLSDGDCTADPGLPDALRARGLLAHDATRLMQAPVSALTGSPVPPVTSFATWPPLAIQREIWAEQGIGPARQAVMDRAALPKAALLGRIDDRAAGAAFIAAAGPLAVLHALEIRPAQRRKGLAGWMMREAAFWAAAKGCETLFLAVTAANLPAIGLYRGLGFQDFGGYCYFSRQN